MPIPSICPSCQATFRVDEKYAGKRARCPRCKEVFQVLVPAPADPADADLVPLDPEPERPAKSGFVALERSRTARDADEEEASAGNILAGGAPQKAKAVRVREGTLPGVGVSAKGVTEAAAATQKTLTPAQILAAFRSEIEPVRPSAMYRLWIAIVAGVMILLPLIYVALVALIVVGLVYYAIHGASVFQNAHGGGAIKGAIAVYIGPLAAGAVVVAFMLKPLFAKAAQGPKQRALDPSIEPLLYAFVDGVCTSVGAPRPSRIEVDCQVNASAHRAGKMLGLFGSELVLTIGLPLAAGLTLKQFAGVLAHEFGHFAQGAGMRLWVLIRTVNMWFARVVYERDSWDQALAEGMKENHVYVIILVALVRAAVWSTRRILWVLMMFGHAVSGFLSRQMEYDADRYQARMVGARTFAQTSWRVREMDLASNGAFEDLRSSWQQRRMPDNFPKLVVANVPQIPKEIVATYRQAAGAAKTGLFDTHPCDRERIEKAKLEEPGDGIFHLEGPATDVFRNFDSLAKATSFDLYRSLLGPEITKDQLYTVAELVETQTTAQEGYTVAARYFLGALNFSQRLPLPWDYPAVPTDLKAANQALIEARRTLLSTREAALATAKQEEEFRNRRFQAETAFVLLKTGRKIKASDYGLKAATLDAAEAARSAAEARLNELAASAELFTSAAARRLTLSLALLQADLVAGRVSDGRERREEARAIYPCAAHFAANLGPEIAQVVFVQQVLLGVVETYQAAKNKNDPTLINALLRAGANLRDQLEQFRWKVGDTIYYPFEHAKDDITLAQFALPPLLPEKDDIGNLLSVSDEAIRRLAGLGHRALGRLAVTAEEVERALGLAPISVPEPDEATA